MNVTTSKQIASQTLLPLKEKEVPASFAGQAIRWAANSNFLNPPNCNQGRISKYLGKPIRSSARIIYMLIIPFFSASAGIFYHLGAATVLGIKANLKVNLENKAYYKELSAAHLESSKFDFLVAMTLGFEAPDRVPFPQVLFGTYSKDIALITALYFSPDRIVQGGLSHQEFVYQELMGRG